MTQETVAPGRPLLELLEVSRIYRSGLSDLRALDGISLTIAAGEFVAIVGQSGSGKSTLMNILGCLDRPSSGSYRVAGQDVAALDPDQLASLRRDHFGFVFQRYNLLATATALENVELPAVYAGRPRYQRLARAGALLARLGLADRATHRPGELSGGQQQRVSIARALMNEALVVLADEPTGALDSQSGQEVLALLRELNGEGRTIILITHDPAVAAHASRIVELKDGRITADSGAVRPPAPTLSEQHHAIGQVLLTELSEAVRAALRSLRVNLFRTALTLLGIIIGVAAVVAMLAIGDGSRAAVMQRISALGTDLLIVRPGAPGVRTAGDVATLQAADAAALIGLPNIEAVVPERYGLMTLRIANLDYRTQVQAVGADYVTAKDWTIASGRFFDAADLQDYAPVVVLGQTVARNLFPDGSEPVGRYVLVKNVPLEVIGVLGPKGATPNGFDLDDIAVVPLTSGVVRLFGSTYLTSITVAVTDTSIVRETEALIRTALLEQHNGTEDFQIRNMAALLETATATQRIMTALLGAVALISLLVGGIGVMNIMLVSVTERTREIGIRMATGARRTAILLQFNTEALVVCGLGGLAGVILGFAATLAAQAGGLPVVLSAGPALMAFACAFATGLVFGYLPARKAARLDPVAALATE